MRHHAAAAAALGLALACLPGCGGGGSAPAPPPPPPPPPADDAGSAPTALAFLGDVLLVAADDGVAGPELWRSDGTPAGTALVKDLAPGATGSAPRHLVTLGGAVYFHAEDGATGRRIWRTDGTAAGTTVVSPAGVDDEAGLVAAAGALWFAIRDAAGVTLWRSDGTPAGTAAVKLVASGPYPAAWELTPFGAGVLLFASANPATLLPYALWRSEGTDATTEPLATLYLGYSVPRLTVAGALAFFAGNDGTSGVELWRTDGTAAGTSLVADLNTGFAGGGLTGGSYPDAITALGGSVYFSATDGEGGELWSSDGTAGGTVLLGTPAPLGAGSSPYDLTPFLGSIWYFATVGPWNQSADGVGLCRTAGPGANLVVQNLTLGFSGIHPRDLTAADAMLYFVTWDAAGGYELWKDDGAAGGRVRVKDLRTGVEGSEPRLLTPHAGLLFFTADDGHHGREVWVSDGSEAGTRLFANVRTTP